MAKSLTDTVLSELRQMNVNLQNQARDIASLRVTADVQFKRIAALQAELDLLPSGRRHRKVIRALLHPSASHNGTNGNGRAG